MVAAGPLGASAGYALPILLFALLYVGNGLIEFLHYFYRGLARSDVESTLTLGQRLATLGCALVALAWRPTLTALAGAMLVPVVVTLAFSGRYAARLGREAGRDVAGCPSGGPAGAAGREFRRDVFPIGAGIVLSALYFRIDIFLIQLWRGAESVGSVQRRLQARRSACVCFQRRCSPSCCRRCAGRATSGR